ncbi:myb-related transcription factor, partner of profilin-like isoform X3 [Hypanus sabinus]|uniref:myb-related transcription factor, partner of profilin-like isoform X3 n=1 Tax=Hypanus sabinus TaxID=79690 RepID=UPI0028C3A4F6|nr:myb-related transcription factor, partner of profilin-like isoform X3 [Hypanus sabinus]
MSEPRAPRFSDAALKVLVEQVRAHKEVLFPSDGRKMPRQTLRQAWREVALYVNLKSVTPRTWLQCRKKFNDLTRTARDKLAHKPRNPACSGERPASIQATTQMEQEALDIVEIYSRRSIENGEAGGQVPQGVWQISLICCVLKHHPGNIYPIIWAYLGGRWRRITLPKMHCHQLHPTNTTLNSTLLL